MEHHFGSAPTILCCMCGTHIPANPANMCVSCLRGNVDITEGILKQLTIHSCRGCGRFLCPPWQTVALESKELMAACLRKVPGLSKVKLIDAVWIWTEPHSMKLKIKITIQKEVINGAILQQAAIIDFTIRNQQCRNCEASYAEGAWHAIVQVRQRVPHKRTFFFLEQLLLKYNAHSDSINIVTFRDGMDFYFMEKQSAVRFIEFLNGHVPTKVKYSRKLVSADHSSNTANFQHNYIVDIAPLCKVRFKNAVGVLRL
jgi:nonsense-mediated mRNA decay protein 3